jgi:hypothetical protein
VFLATPLTIVAMVAVKRLYLPRVDRGAASAPDPSVPIEAPGEPSR